MASQEGSDLRHCCHHNQPKEGHHWNTIRPQQHLRNKNHKWRLRILTLMALLKDRQLGQLSLRSKKDSDQNSSLRNKWRVLHKTRLTRILRRLWRNTTTSAHCQPQKFRTWHQNPAWRSTKLSLWFHGTTLSFRRSMKVSQDERLHQEQGLKEDQSLGNQGKLRRVNQGKHRYLLKQYLLNIFNEIL